MAARGGSSTDKQLHIIRGGGAQGKQAGASGPGKGGKSEPESRRARSLLHKLTAERQRLRKGVTVGVDIAPTSLRLVKMEHNGGEFPGLLGCREIPFGPKNGPDSPEFPSFLRRQLDEFCQGDKGLEIWSLVSSAQAELFHVNIPKVAPARLSDTVYWTAQKEKPFNESEFVMDFEIQGEVDDKGVSKQRVLVYLVPLVEIERVRTLFAETGYKPAGLTISPIALQTIFRKRWVPEAERPCANIFVGRNWSRIDIFAHGNLVLSRGVNTGVNSLVDAFAEGYNEKEQLRFAAAEKAAREAEAASPPPALHVQDEPVFELELEQLADSGAGAGAASAMFELELDVPESSPSPEPDPEPAVSFSTPEALMVEPPRFMDAEIAKQVLHGKLLGKPFGADLPGAEISEAETIALAGSAIHRLGRQLDRTFHFFSEMHGGATVEHMCFSGGLFSNRMLLDSLAADLGIPADLLDPLASDLRTASGVSVPTDQGDRLALNLVTGLALCDRKSTPNLLRTYKDKDREQKTMRQGNMVYAMFLGLVLVLAGVWFWQSGVASGKRAELAGLQARIAQFNPLVDQNLLLSLAGDLGRKQHRLKELSHRYEGLAVFNELTRLLPDSVRLHNVGIEFPDAGEATGQTAQSGAPGAKGDGGFVIIDGQVAGSPEMFDAQLATFLIKIQGSPLFSGAMIHKRELERSAAGGEVLRFIVHVQVRKEGAA